MKNERKLEGIFEMGRLDVSHGNHGIFGHDSGGYDQLSPSSVEVLAEQLKAITASVVRLEGMIRNEIMNLKTEQIARIERQLERQEQELREVRDERNRFTGGAWVLYSVIMGLGSALGALATTFGLKLFGK